MSRRSHYSLLGIPRTESPRGIRAAYRALAKKHHPDVAGEQATRTFREITEAFDVLSDPARRQRYDEQLKSAELASRSIPVAPGRSSPQPEPLIPTRDAWRSRRLDTLDFEVRLTPDEAERGCVVPVTIPVASLCPICRGSGGDFWPCIACRARGLIASEQRVWIEIPPLSQPRALLELVVRGAGAHGLRLRFHVSHAA